MRGKLCRWSDVTDADKLCRRSSRPGVALMRSNVSDEWISSVGWVRVGGSGERGGQWRGQCTADRPGMVKGSSADQNPTFSTNPGDLSGATWKGKSRPLFPTMTRSWQNLVLWPKSVARPTDEVCWNGCLFWPPWEVAEEWGTWATLITRKASLLRTAAKPKKAKKFIPLYVLMPPSSTPNIYVYP